MIRRASPEVLHPMPAALLAELSDRENPCELVCILHQRTDAEDRLRTAVNGAKSSPLLVLCDRPTSPGNLGTIIRSADAFGACGVLMTGHAADPYDTQCIRASIGTVFHLPVLALNSCETAVEFIRSLGDFQIAGTSAKGTMCFHEADFTRPTVLIVGNETSAFRRPGRKPATCCCASRSTARQAPSTSAARPASACMRLPVSATSTVIVDQRNTRRTPS